MRWRKLRFERAIERLSQAQILAMRKAAHQCARLKAKPLEYIAAQFQVFDLLSDRLGRTLLPMPQHLHGPNAEARYHARMSNELQRRSEAALISAARRCVPGSEGHVFDPEVQMQAFRREARKLANLVSLLRLSEEEILVRHQTEFTVEFLAMRGIDTRGAEQ